jgi:outer membrane protein OmpA-like peptidoglycan-associated protein
MLASRKRSQINIAGVVVLAGLTLPTGILIAGEQPSAQQIINALKPAKITRGLSTTNDAARSAEEAKFVDTLRNRRTRSLTSDERDKIASLAKTRPSIDLEINFDFDSAAIGPNATPQVTTLGEALASPDLKGVTFVLAGHTDAKGTDAYNQGLSERRAESVKRFLQEKYGIEANQLVTVGYGKTQLKNQTDPLSGENRRVQVVNVADK